MALSIELNEISDLETKQRLEHVIRDCIGDRPKEEDWKIWIHASGGYCQIVVKGPSYKRERFFFDHVRTLPEKIREWFEAYPFR